MRYVRMLSWIYFYRPGLFFLGITWNTLYKRKVHRFGIRAEGKKLLLMEVNKFSFSELLICYFIGTVTGSAFSGSVIAIMGVR